MNAMARAALFLLPMTAVHPGINITLGDLCLFALLFWRTGATPARLAPYFVTVLGLAAWVTATSLWQGLSSRYVVGATDLIQAVFVFAIVLPFGWRVAGTLSVRSVAKALTLSGLTQAAVAVAQIPMPQLRLPTQPALGLGEFGSRPIGLVGNPNALGLVCSWTVPFAVYLSVTSRSRRARWGWALAAVVITGGGTLGFSKAALVTLPVALVGSVILLGGRRGPVTTLIVAAMGLGAVKFASSIRWFASVIQYRLTSSESLGSRLEGYVEAWAQMDRWSLLGVGPGLDWRFGPGDVRLHNPVIGMAVQFGLVAAVLLLSAKLMLVFAAGKSVRRRETRTFLWAFLIAEAALLVHPLYWMRAHYLPLLLLVWWGTRSTSHSMSSDHATLRNEVVGEWKPCVES